MRRTLLFLLLSGLVIQARAASDGVDRARTRVRPSVPKVALRLEEYGSKGDFKRARIIAHALQRLVAALDARNKTTLAVELKKGLADEDSKAVARIGLAILYWDLHHLLAPGRMVKAPALARTRILRAKQSYLALRHHLPRSERNRQLDRSLQRELDRLLSFAPQHGEEANSGWQPLVRRSSRRIRSDLHEGFAGIVREKKR